jgi:CubicO group peptidase (beta-lactamase class C family)
MLTRHGHYGGTRILGRKTVEYMLASHLGGEIKKTKLAVPTHIWQVTALASASPSGPRLESPAWRARSATSRPGASGTNWWADPREELVVVWMMHTPGTGPIRSNLRQMINALVYQALVE